MPSLPPNLVSRSLDIALRYWWVPVFLLLIVRPTIRELDKFPARLDAYRDGLYPGIIYTAAAIATLVVSLPVTYWLAERVNFLNWSLLGYNFVLAPLFHASNSGGAPTDGGASAGGSAAMLGGVDGPLAIATVLGIVIGLGIIIFLNVWYEEHSMLRRNYKRVAIWAVMHLVMGIPLFAVLILFPIGVVFKFVFDRHGRETAYAAHVTYNLILIAFLAGGLILL